MNTSHCAWMKVPGVGCAGTLLCERIQHISGPEPTIPPGGDQSPPSSLGGNNVWVGVNYVPSSTRSYGIQGLIKMSQTGDTFTYSDECHHRWPGSVANPAGGTPLLQVGTAQCARDGSAQYEKWCVYIPANPANYGGQTIIQYWPLTKYPVSDTFAHQYSFQSRLSQSGQHLSTYDCYWDTAPAGLSLTVENGPSWLGPQLMAVAEINFGSGVTVADFLAGDSMNPAIQYLDMSDTWQNVGHEEYSYNPSSTLCTVDHWGPNVLATESLTVGTNQNPSCPAALTTAW